LKSQRPARAPTVMSWRRACLAAGSSHCCAQPDRLRQPCDSGARIF